MRKHRDVQRPVGPHPDDGYGAPELSAPASNFVPYVFGGAMMAAAMAFAGFQFGQNADAHISAASAGFTGDFGERVSPVAKGSLMDEGSLRDLAALRFKVAPEVAAGLKGDLANFNPVRFEDPEPASALKQAPLLDKTERSLKKLALRAGPPIPMPRPRTLIKIVAASAEPDTWKLEKTFKLPRAEKQKAVAKRRVRLAEENCLARAIYFEARSETELGQLAVAKVILNRVKDPAFPKSICGVVYQGAQRSNSCQFSFACDGSPDDPKTAGSWANAKRVAQKALNGDQTVRVMGSATHYHADYVRPRWAKSMRKLIKIGRHIFYSDG